MVPRRSPIPCEAALAVMTNSRLMVFRPAHATIRVVRSRRNRSFNSGAAASQMSSDATDDVAPMASSVVFTRGSSLVGPARNHGVAAARPPDTITASSHGMTRSSA